MALRDIKSKLRPINYLRFGASRHQIKFDCNQNVGHVHFDLIQIKFDCNQNVGLVHFDLIQIKFDCNQNVGLVHFDLIQIKFDCNQNVGLVHFDLMSRSAKSQIIPTNLFKT